ncbi:MAG: hypothetical protein LBQ54_14990 [Planctomycetaceae bacterium]|nr:hypothetical protein [Planctomycetaceae bacterium]
MSLFLQWRIQSALDSGKEPGRFLRWWIQKDRTMKVYYQQMTQLHSLLQSEADVPLPAVPHPFRKQKHPKLRISLKRKTFRVFPFIKAASILLVFMQIGFYHFSSEPRRIPNKSSFCRHKQDSAFSELICPVVTPVQDTYQTGEEMLDNLYEDSELSRLMEHLRHFFKDANHSVEHVNHHPRK